MTKCRIKGAAAAFIMATVLMTAPENVFADNTAIGYGQGTSVDCENRPGDAVSFDNRYCEYNAYATTPDRQRVIITFDQGYENGYTADILDTLKEKNVKAIFFLTGDYAKKETALVKRMIDEGHVLGNHGMTHASLPKLSEEEARQEIMSLHEYVKNEYGYEMQYFRFPCGEYSEDRIKTVCDLGYKTLFWSYAYVDWQTDSQPDCASALEGLRKSVHGGEILLLHSVSKTNAEILGSAIDSFRSAGFIV
jgi:peptidoglycan-N-acetylmuramic acid deacetylase